MTGWQDDRMTGRQDDRQRILDKYLKGMPLWKGPAGWVWTVPVVMGLKMRVTSGTPKGIWKVPFKIGAYEWVCKVLFTSRLWMGLEVSVTTGAPNRRIILVVLGWVWKVPLTTNPLGRVWTVPVTINLPYRWVCTVPVVDGELKFQSVGPCPSPPVGSSICSSISTSAVKSAGFIYACLFPPLHCMHYTASPSDVKRGGTPKHKLPLHI
jgi:hypothetical protein